MVAQRRECASKKLWKKKTAYLHHAANVNLDFMAMTAPKKPHALAITAMVKVSAKRDYANVSLVGLAKLATCQVLVQCTEKLNVLDMVNASWVFVNVQTAGKDMHATKPKDARITAPTPRMEHAMVIDATACLAGKERTVVSARRLTAQWVAVVTVFAK